MKYLKRLNYSNFILSLIFCALCVLSYQLDVITNDKYVGLTEQIEEASIWVGVNGGYLDVEVMNSVRIDN